MEITFIFKGDDKICQCNDTKEKVGDIFHNFMKNIDINSIVFLYSGHPIDGNLSISKIINNHDLERKKISILVIEKNSESNSCLVDSKDIICPKCGESAALDIEDYKILFQCKNGHNIGNVFLNEYEKKQKIDISKIICDKCKKSNKSESYKNIFYRCNQCKQNLCVKCQNIHQNENKDHICINYDDKNYICELHNEKYTSYCEQCKKNICLFCKKDHKEHKLINYENILPDINDAKNNLNKLRNKINEFKGIIDDYIRRLKMIKDNIEFYYGINTKIFDSLNTKHINYEILSSYNNITKSKILKDVINIIENKDKNKTILNLFEIDNKMINKSYEEITIQYKIEKNDKEIKLFGNEFVNNNKDNCKIIINEKEYDLVEKISLKNLAIKNNTFEIKLRIIQLKNDLSFMFENCSSLLSISDLSKLNTINVKNMNSMFFDCSSLISLSDTSNWITKNTLDMKYMFYGCSSLLSLPDISKWDTSNVKDMECMFLNCASLKSFPDISNWNIQNVKNLGKLLVSCKSLNSLPDISKWNTSNVQDMNNMFTGCALLKSLPDISNWNTSNVEDMSGMFGALTSLKYLPDISKWNTAKVKNMNRMFGACTKLLSLPDISNWNTSNVNNMSEMFYYCASLKSLPNLSKWDISNVKEMKDIFLNCPNLSNIPKFAK